MLGEFEVGIVPQHDEAEAEDSHDPQDGGGGGGGELREEGVGDDVEHEVGHRELQLPAGPQVVEEGGLAREGANQTDQLQGPDCGGRGRGGYWEGREGEKEEWKGGREGVGGEWNEGGREVRLTGCKK